MTSDEALTALEALLALLPTPADREAVLCAAETYGDARADEALYNA